MAGARVGIAQLSEEPGTWFETMTYYGGKDLANAFRTVRKNTIQIAEDIPEDKYDFKPTPESRSIKQTLAHIATLTVSQWVDAYRAAGLSPEFAVVSTFFCPEAHIVARHPA